MIHLRVNPNSLLSRARSLLYLRAHYPTQAPACEDRTIRLASPPRLHSHHWICGIRFVRIWTSALNERVWLARDKDGKMFSLFYIIWYVHLALGMVLRSGQEDKMLEDRFGTE